MRRVVRSSTRTPRVFSRSATARLTAAFGTPRARAAAEKPLRSTTLASIASCAGVQIRLIEASIDVWSATIVSLERHARQPPNGLEFAPFSRPPREDRHENLHARNVGG